MSSKYRLSLWLDDATNIIVGRVVGPMPSRELCRGFLAAYEKIDRPWRYNRLIDYRKFTGSIDYSEIETFAHIWAGWLKDDPVHTKVAFVTHDAMELVRTQTFRHLFPYDQVQSFDTADQALDWIQGTVPDASTFVNTTEVIMDRQNIYL